VIWARVEQSSNPEDVAAFLQAYPDGQFAPAARLKLQQLQPDSTGLSGKIPSH
jgi:regulator of sirC expression with transglutaminase-like and TPR domain